MKRSILILALASIFLVMITGCALNKSDYIEKIAPKIDQYHTFDEGILKVYHNLLTSYTVQYPDQTYGDLLLGTIALIMQGKKVNPSQVWNPADYQIFKGTVQMMYERGSPFCGGIEEHQTSRRNRGSAQFPLQLRAVCCQCWSKCTDHLK